MTKENWVPDAVSSGPMGAEEARKGVYYFAPVLPDSSVCRSIYLKSGEGNHYLLLVLRFPWLCSLEEVFYFISFSSPSSFPMFELQEVKVAVPGAYDLENEHGARMELSRCLHYLLSCLDSDERQWAQRESFSFLFLSCHVQKLHARCIHRLSMHAHSKYTHICVHRQHAISAYFHYAM